MREILFRGKCVENGEWIEFNIIHEIFGDFIQSIKEKHNRYDIIPETIQQYTGLTDCKGNKIFEGDIIKVRAYGGGFCKSVVYFKNGKFAVDGDRYGFKDICQKSVEVIGNIHDNHEILEVVENGE